VGADTKLVREITRKWQEACEDYDASWKGNLLTPSNGKTTRKEAFANLMKVKTELDRLVDKGSGLKDPFVVGIINSAQPR